MLEDLYAAATGWIFETLIQPPLYALGLMDWAEDLFAWLDFALFGLLGVAVVYAVCRPLEAWRPVEPVADARAPADVAPAGAHDEMAKACFDALEKHVLGSTAFTPQFLHGLEEFALRGIAFGLTGEFQQRHIGIFQHGQEQRRQMAARHFAATLHQFFETRRKLSGAGGIRRCHSSPVPLRDPSRGHIVR